jgi:hypothetical protein
MMGVALGGNVEIWVSTPAFTGMVEVNPKTWEVVSAMGPLKWGVGKPWRVVLNWCHRKWDGEVKVTDLNGRRV